MSGYLLDSNILLEIATADATWFARSARQLRLTAERGPVFINPIIYAEIAPAFGTAADLERWLSADVFQRLPLPYPAAGWLRKHTSSIAVALVQGTRRYRTFSSEHTLKRNNSR